MTSIDLHRVRDETFVREIDFHWELASTNDQALKWAEEESIVTPLLVLADKQTQGRGRGPNRWLSSPGSLTFSLLLPLDGIPADRLPQISLTVGLAICQALETFAPLADLAIKWPNDVYLNEKKAAGILIEMPPRRPPHGVIGVGINANNSLTDYDADVQSKSVSLIDAIEQEVDLSDLLITCLDHLDRYLNLLRENPTAIVDQWRAYHLLEGRQVEVDAYGDRIRGVCDGIDPDGALRVVTPSGLQRCIGGIVTDFERREL
ncbi:MAG: biotin--[acetyl-CoA-carboxylase] ligase [Planctomycetales bacterium]|nr:biotin--[acetyl-CoA-carboxylase] ligase [Planctomycetales bacterium]MCA9168525.1 biotin--[acetyl-CoA-carboxylase] ligase [Planctomycetales bacterium]